MKKSINIILLFIGFFGFAQSNNSIGIEAGLYKNNNRLYGSGSPEKFFPINGNTAYFSIPFEHHWTSKNSIILKPSILTNNDLFWVQRMSDGSDYRVKSKLNYLRFSASFSRKLGNPDRFYGLIKIGVGVGTFIKGTYDLNEYDIINNSFVSKNTIDRNNNKLRLEEFFSEGAIGGGVKLNKKFDIQLTLNYLTGFGDLNTNSEVPFESLKEYSMVNHHSFRSNFYGVNVSVIHNFNFLKL